ncbi:hypothetical protein FB451DRAFT_312038 [Mycena latifolia]|nr:hypothetical protein FB451DRAFT_312038 [Mycena latifolia]
MAPCTVIDWPMCCADASPWARQQSGSFFNSFSVLCMYLSGLRDSTLRWSARCVCCSLPITIFVYEDSPGGLDGPESGRASLGTAPTHHRVLSRLSSSFDAPRIRMRRYRDQTRCSTPLQGWPESLVVSDAPVLSVMKPIATLVILLCETAQTMRSNKDAAAELASYARYVTASNVVVE